MNRYLRTGIFFAGSIFLTLFGAISTISAQQRVPADFIEQQRNNAKKEIADLRTTQDINLLKAFIENWQNQDNVKSRIVAAYIEEIQKDFAPFIELFNQEAGQQIILSQHAQELADSLAHDQGRIFTEKLAQLIKEHGISLLFAAAFTDENNDHLGAFFDAAIQENAIFSALPGQAERQIRVLHLVAHLVKHQQRRLDDDFQEDYSYFEPIARVIEQGRADLVSLLLHSGLLRFFLEKEDHNLLVKMLNVALINQQPEIVALLLQEPGIDCNNARMLAQFDFHAQIYSLNEENININVPLTLAIKYYRHPQGSCCLDALLKCPELLLEQKDFYTGESEFWSTISQGNNHALETFLGSSLAHKKVSFDSDHHLLSYASSNGNLYNLQILLRFYRKKAEHISKKTNQTTSSLMSIILNNKNSEGKTPLMAAVEEGHLDCVAFLLSQPEIDLNAVNNNQASALIIAAQSIAAVQNDAGEGELQDQEAREELHKKLKNYEYIIDSIIGFQKKTNFSVRDIRVKDIHDNNFLNYLINNDYLYKKYSLLFLTAEECEIMLLVDRAKSGNVESFMQFFELIQAKSPLLVELQKKGFFTDFYANCVIMYQDMFTRARADRFYLIASSSRESFDKELLFSAIRSDKTELLAFALELCGTKYEIAYKEDREEKTFLVKLFEHARHLGNRTCAEAILKHVRNKWVRAGRIEGRSFYDYAKEQAQQEHHVETEVETEYDDE